MTLVKFNNHQVRKTIDNVFDELFSNLPSAWSETLNEPAANVHEDKSGFHLELNAPGLSKEDFKVNIEKDLLTISYEKKEENKSEEYKTVRCEFTQRSFKRSFSLNDQIDAENIQAKYENGILKLFLPRKDEVKPSTKQINIQ
jgi:HSP20 family protein